ncbi:alpha/beta hydrolase [Microbacterium sp. NPDC090007]|uniref:alpha/beta hydrolase n=1 Tax=Microbacterium sp. NPDC090007 TaxID=3364204 RepID=UPI0037FBE77E
MSTDPAVLVPGSPASIDAAIRGWRARAGRADDNGAALAKVGTPEGWKGSAPAAFARHVRKVSASWKPLHESLTVASAALQEYNSTLSWARDQAGIAIDTWLQALQADASAPLLPTTQADATRAETLREKAWSILRHAQSRVAEAGDRAAGIIRTAAAQPTLSPEGWQRVAERVSTSEQAATLLASLSAADIDDVLAARPDLVALLKQLDAAAVNRWWTGLSVAAQNALVVSASEAVGTLEGIPFDARDKSNRRALAQRLRDAEGEIADAETPLPLTPPPTAVDIGEHQRRLKAAREELEALRGVRDGLESDADRPSRLLVSLTVDHPPLAAVAIGNPDTADNVTIAVPGMTSEAANMREWAQSCENLHDEQVTIDPSRTHSVIAWIGYRAPSSPASGDFSVLGNEDALKGADRLNRALLGVDAVNSGATMNLLGHSYGSTTSSIALAGGPLRVDTFVAIGSAGFPSEIDQASDLNADAVFAGQATDVPPLIGASGDDLAWIGRISHHPSNPMDPEFGARPFGTGDGGGTLVPVGSHSTSTAEGDGYLDRGTESLANIARATTGHGEQITPPTSRRWIEDDPY